ncbi:MAG: hypothetical protein AABX53_01430 [Nanoarchaeota archaeon]
MIEPRNPPTAKGYIAYFASKMGSSRLPPPTFALEEATATARGLHGQYDLGIELAADGLATGYIFNHYGLPTKAVKLTRKGRGATWRPLEEITDQDIRDRRLLLFEWDVVTGRILKRAVKELGKYSPQYIDLLLTCGKTLTSFESFNRISKSVDIRGDIEVDQRGRAGFWLDCKSNVPEGIRKTIVLIPDNHRR